VSSRTEMEAAPHPGKEKFLLNLYRFFHYAILRISHWVCRFLYWTEPITTILKCMMNAAKIGIIPKWISLFLPHSKYYGITLLAGASRPAVNG